MLWQYEFAQIDVVLEGGRTSIAAGESVRRCRLLSGCEGNIGEHQRFNMSAFHG